MSTTADLDAKLLAIRSKADQTTDAVRLASLQRQSEVVKSKLQRAHARERKLAKVEARRKNFFARLDALKVAAPTLQAQWNADRAHEEKRLNKRRAELIERTRKDLLSAPDWMTPLPDLPPPIEQPHCEEESIDIAPPREGLLPGTYSILDPLRLSPVAHVQALPPTWTARHVASRLLAAHDTLRALPEKDKPKGFNALWPAYRVEAGELAVQFGAGTLEEARVRRSTSAIEVELMEEALTWIPQFLSHLPALELNWLNFWVDDPNSEIDSITAPTEYFAFIAEALNAAAEPVR